MRISTDHTIDVYFYATDLEKLANSASPNAFYDSAANQTTLNKNPYAERYIRIALDWIQNRGSTEFLLWIAGESRILTSLIAQRTAEFCDSKQQNSLLTTFFFSTSDPSRNSANYFVSTLAYGIIQSIPISRSFIAQAVEEDPLILSRSLEKQFKKLILEPLNQLFQAPENQDLTFPYVIIIDALNECEVASERTRILSLFKGLYSNRPNQNRLPWKVLFTSKPDQTISEAFPTSMASRIIISETAALQGQSQADKSPTSHRPTQPFIAQSACLNTRLQHPPSQARLLSIGMRGMAALFRDRSNPISDGGGIRGLSALIILEEIMHRLKFSMKKENSPKPWEVFELAGGTGTGGYASKIVSLTSQTTSLDSS